METQHLKQWILEWNSSLFPFQTSAWVDFCFYHLLWVFATSATAYSTQGSHSVYIYSNLLHLTGKLHSLTNLNLAAIWGWFLLLTIISSEGEQWGRYNLPKHLWHTRLWRFPEKWGSQKPRVSILYIYSTFCMIWGTSIFGNICIYIYLYIYM